MKAFHRRKEKKRNKKRRRRRKFKTEKQDNDDGDDGYSPEQNLFSSSSEMLKIVVFKFSQRHTIQCARALCFRQIPLYCCYCKEPKKKEEKPTASSDLVESQEKTI
jgi:hypothetical protein